MARKAKVPSLAPVSPTPSTGASFVLPSAYTLTFDETGLRVFKGGALVAGLGPTLLDADWHFEHRADGFAWPTITQRSLAQPQTNQVVLEHTYAGSLAARAVYRFTVDGNDLHLTVQVTNLGSVTWHRLGVLLMFCLIDDFGTNPDSYDAWSYNLNYMQSQFRRDFYTDTEHEGTDWCYPSYFTGAAVAWINTLCGGGQPTAIATWVRDDVLTPCAFEALYPSGDPSKRGIATMVDREVRPGDTRSIAFTTRFCATLDRETLVAGYRDYCHVRSPLQYVPDARPWGYFSHLDADSIRPDNPYGYHDNGTNLFRRFDRQDGAAHYSTFLQAGLLAGGYQGMILWQPQGLNPRGASYRPDFHVWPPPTDDPAHAPWTHDLCDPFTAVGLKMGFQSRPGVTLTSASYAKDYVTEAATSPAGLASLRYAVNDMVAMGFTADGYMDSFVATPNLHRVIAAIRSHIGPGPQLYLETATVASAPYAGAYGRVTWNPALNDYQLLLTAQASIVRLVYPEMPVAAVIVNVGPDGDVGAYTWCFTHQISPLVADYLVPAHASLLAPLVAYYIDPATHQWLR